MKTFSERVVEAALSIPKGRVCTYGDIAKACGAGGQAARSISGILARSYRNGQEGIPFHRIVYRNGQVWKNENYNNQPAKLYQQEGIELNEKGYISNFISRRYEF